MTILNQREYRLAKARRAQLEKALSPQAIIQGMADSLPAELSASRVDTLKTELKRVSADIEAYERLRTNSPGLLESIEANELGLLPILGRVARQLSQRELADLLGMKEQQIQRYENDRYSTISLERFQRVLSVLEVEVHPRLTPIRPKDSETTGIAINLNPELLRTLRSLGWFDLPRTLSIREVQDRINLYVSAAKKFGQTKTFHRKTQKEPNSSDGLLELWTARVISLAAERRGRMKGRFNIVDTTWLQSLLRLSVFPDGPRRAADALREHGIIFIVEKHLPKTLLDGAAFLLSGGIPVVALTLRHDRVDNFWFTLFHELGHVYLHFNSGLQDGFLDDELESPKETSIERAADEFAVNRLISHEVWENSVARFTKSEDAVIKFARTLNIHPAIVVGRIRAERGFHLFTNMIGNGQVRHLFAGYTP